MKELLQQFKRIKKTLGIEAFEIIGDYYYTLMRKIEDLTKSRDSWRNKYLRLKEKN